jgi:hypothetical protein
MKNSVVLHDGYAGKDLEELMNLKYGRTLRKLGLSFLILCECSLLPAGQNNGTVSRTPIGSQPDESRRLEAQMTSLQSEITRFQSQMGQMEKEAEELRSELHETQVRLAALQASPSSPSVLGAAKTNAPSSGQSESGPQGGHSMKSLLGRLSTLEENQDLLQTKVGDQYQTKVESASKYRVVLSGMALLNVFSNRGAVDNLDVPQVAQEQGPLASNAAFGATVRQSTIGLDVFGPTLAGARTYGEVQTDFFGGFPNAPNGVTAGIMRVRTATIHMDWSNTSLVAGQDGLFFAPLYPTSFASVAEPAFAYSGDLWAWVPQIRVEHRFRFSDQSAVTVQGGILDSLTGELPANNFYRSPDAGERSGQPGYAARFAWSGPAFGRTVAVGVGGYYSLQNWGFGRRIDSWVATADWDAPLGRWFSISGELYRGNAIGGLGGGLGRSVLYNGFLTSPTTSLLGLNSAGGWAQLKFQPTERLQFNGAFGEDNSFASDLRYFPVAYSYYNPLINRNQNGLINAIYFPRSDLLLSLEYRRLWSSEIDKAPYRAGQINLGVGVLF